MSDKLSRPLTVAEYEARELSQSRHRGVNTFMMVLVVVMGYFFAQSQLAPLYERITGLEELKTEKEEISKIMTDESFRSCKYSDSLGNATIGFGHLVRSGEQFNCISPHEAIDILKVDYAYAKRSVEIRYPWAQGEVKNVLINMTFQLGEHRLAKFTKTLEYLEAKDYEAAAGELLDSVMYKQAPNRLIRHSSRIMALTEGL